MKYYVNNKELNELLAEADIQIATVLTVTSLKAVAVEQSDSDADEFFLALSKILKDYYEKTKIA